ncbi:MAG TPA: DinB family protein [Acidimicrobiales bacterium]
MYATTYIRGMPITPDSKDWTWVLERPCRECGFDAESFPREEMGRRLRANATIWRPELATADARIRPNPERWSVLEYACHVRDVFRIFDWRVSLMQSEENPQFPNWDQDETAVVERYDLQESYSVALELEGAAATLADRFDALRAEEWTRPGVRSNGSVFTIESIGRYLLHDCVHHAWDIESQ